MTERRSTSHTSRDQIEREVHAERQKISGTIDALRDALSVERLSEQVMKSVLQNPDGLGSEITDAIRKNPIAAAVAGAGLVWLFSGTRLQSSAARALGLAGETASEKLGDAAEATGAALGNVAEEAGRWTSKKVRDASGDANALFTEQPLFVGLAALAAGVALGVMFPATERAIHRTSAANGKSSASRQKRRGATRRATSSARSKSKAGVASGAKSAGKRSQIRERGNSTGAVTYN